MLLVLSFLAGCATVVVRPTIQDTEIIDALFGKARSTLIATLAEPAFPNFVQWQGGFEVSITPL